MKSQTTKIQAAAALAVILAGSNTFAQSSTVSTPAASAATVASTSTMTSSTPLKELKPGAKKFGAIFVSQGFVTAKDIEAHGAGNAAYTSENAIGINYKLTEKVKVELEHLFAYTFNRASMVADPLDYQTEAYIVRSPVALVSYASDQRIAGSDPIGYKARFYFGIDDASKKANRRGVLRFDAATTWNLNTLVSIYVALSPRFSFYNENAKEGSESLMRLVAGPQANLNFSDKVRAYYAPTLDLRTMDTMNRAQARFEKLNSLIHEVGMNFTAGPVTINPAYATTVDLNTGTGFQQIDSTEYDLNIIAAF